jgi:hypothetical protein
MSTTQLVYDTGNIFIPAGPTQHQIGPTLDVRKYSKIKVVAHDSLPSGSGNDVHIRFRVKEGNVAIELPEQVALVGTIHNADTVIDVPGRELEIFVRDFPATFPGRNLQLFIFGLES